MKRHDTFFLGILSILLLLVGIGLGWHGQSQLPNSIINQPFRKDSLDSQRQLLEVKADSLVTLIQRIQRTNEGVFEMKNTEDAIEILGQKGRETAFNRLFFNDESLQSMAKIKNTGLEINLDEYRLYVHKHEQDDVDYVKIPAEIIQSMLLSIEN